MGELFYGSELSSTLVAEMKTKVDTYRLQGRRAPRLDTIIVGNNPASLSYIKGKHNKCLQAGIENVVHHLEEQITQSQLEEEIQKCNENDNCDGILLQMPLPAHLDENQAILKMDPSKDVDGLHPINIGHLFSGEPRFVPCTPLGVMKILEALHVDLAGKQAVVVGRSRLVGNPVARLLQDANATVTICHSKTKDLASVTRNADILVVAMGRPQVIRSEYVKEGAVVIDVGINRVDGHLCGDVDTQDVLDKVSYITPVPKGVGPMTICALLLNTLQSYEEREHICR